MVAATGWIYSSEALVGFEPLTFMGSRFLLAGIILSVFARKQFLHINFRQLIDAFFVGVIFSLTMIFWIEGLHYSQHMGIGAFIFSLGVLFAPVMSLFFGDKPPSRIWVALLIGGLGLYLLTVEGQFIFGPGEYLFIASAFSMALFINITTHISARIHPLILTTIQLITVGFLLLLLAIQIEGITWPTEIDIWIWFLASVLLATSLRFLLQIWAHGMAPASHTTVILTLEPLWVVLLGVWWYGESMSAIQVTGCLLIFASVIFSRIHALTSLLKGK